MSTFATMVRQKVADATAAGRLATPRRSLEGSKGQKALSSGLSLVQHLASTNQACAADENCKEVATFLQVAQQGTVADARTALTRLQRLLSHLTAADSDVAADATVQHFRRGLHLVLDH